MSESRTERGGVAVLGAGRAGWRIGSASIENGADGDTLTLAEKRTSWAVQGAKLVS